MNLDKIQKNSHQILNFWKDGAKGWAPIEVTKKIEIARIDWLIDLTDCLTIWNIKNEDMTAGDLILAYANLGALVEGWLKLFYCIYYNNYCDEPLYYKNSQKDKQSPKMIEPNDLSIEYLKQFSRGILWEINDYWDSWINKVQYRRNANHSFNHREIGTPSDFSQDIIKLGKLIEKIDQRLPYPDACHF